MEPCFLETDLILGIGTTILELGKQRVGLQPFDLDEPLARSIRHVE
jgi:hypothetical protein